MPQVGTHSPEPRDPTQAPNFYDDVDTSSTVDTTPADTAIVIEDDAPAATPDIQAVETEARSMGWVPREEWRGPKAAWVDAAQFVERGRTVLPIVNAQLARERQANAELRERLAELERTSNEFSKFRDEQSQARIEVEETALRAQRRQAQEASDWDTYDALTDKIIDLRVDKKIKSATPKSTDTVNANDQKIFTDFVSSNTALQDPQVQKAWGLTMAQLRQIGVQTRGVEFMQEALEHVRRTYPDKFPRARKPLADVNGSGGNGGMGGKGYAQLKPEYREQCDKMVKAGELKNREQFVAECGVDAFIGN